MIRGVPTLLLVLAVSNQVLPQSPSCSTAQALAAETGVDGLKSWADLYAAFKQFRACDDGAIAEGWSDFTARSLAKKWGTLSDLQQLVAKDGAFHRFVIKHIDSTADNEDLRLALANALEHCPRRARGLCNEIAAAARQALALH
jgi:hypothetical protein